MLAVSLVSVCVLGWAPPASRPAAEVTTGLAFGDSVPEREQIPLREVFDRSLALACEREPCTAATCADDEPTLGLTIAGSDRVYSLTWVATHPLLEEPIRDESSCELCSVIELGEQVAAELDQICARLDGLDEAPGRLRIESTPRGATLTIDGEVVGQTPWIGELPPGRHVLELQAKGHADQRRTVEVHASLELREHVELAALARPPGAGPFRPGWPGWVSLGAALACGVAGATLIALHGSPWYGRCSGANRDADGDCRYVYATRPLGIGLAVIGGAALGAGIGLSIWAHKDDRSNFGAGLGLHGAF